MSLLWWCPFKSWKEKRADLQFTSTDYLSIVLTPVRIRWTIPLRPMWHTPLNVLYLSLYGKNNNRNINILYCHFSVIILVKIFLFHLLPRVDLEQLNIILNVPLSRPWQTSQERGHHSREILVIVEWIRPLCFVCDRVPWRLVPRLFFLSQWHFDPHVSVRGYWVQKIIFKVD